MNEEQQENWNAGYYGGAMPRSYSTSCVNQAMYHVAQRERQRLNDLMFPRQTRPSNPNLPSTSASIGSSAEDIDPETAFYTLVAAEATMIAIGAGYELWDWLTNGLILLAAALAIGAVYFAVFSRVKSVRSLLVPRIVIWCGAAAWTAWAIFSFESFTTWLYAAIIGACCTTGIVLWNGVLVKAELEKSARISPDGSRSGPRRIP